MEDTISDEEGTQDDPAHRNYDAYLEGVPLGTHYPSTQKCVPGCKRRSNDRLGCTRVPFIEPIGASRERFYEQNLSLALAWYCEEAPKVEQDGSITWTFRWDAPRGVDITPQVVEHFLNLWQDRARREDRRLVVKLFERGDIITCTHKLGAKTERWWRWGLV